MLWRGGHHEDEASLLVRVGRGGWRWSGHMLVGHGQTLPEDFHIISSSVDGGRSMGIVLDVRGKGGLASSGNHGRRETVGFMDHLVESQHDAWDLLHPCPGGSAFKQARSEHVVHGPTAALVDGVPLRMVRSNQEALDAQRAHQLPPNITHELTTAVGRETAGGAKVWHRMSEESFAHRVCGAIAGRYKDSVSGVAIHKQNEEFLSVVGGERAHNVYGERVLCTPGLYGHNRSPSDIVGNSELPLGRGGDRI